MAEVHDPNGFGRRVRRTLSAVDGALFDAVAVSPSPLLDHTMRPLSAAADNSVLWMAVAGVLGTGGLSQRRGAVRGLAAIAATSLLVNQGFKRIYARRRPISWVPTVRARRRPTSNSFPSGHSASAAAFATGIWLENRKSGYAVAPLAAAVGLSRVATGAHYPGDVVAGFAIGTAVALGGARLVPPLKRHRAELEDPTVDLVDTEPDGAGLVVVLNPASGDGTGRRVAAELRKSLPAAEIVELQPGSDVDAIARDVASRAVFVGVAGGDGTVATVAAHAIAADKPLAVFPAGTFNHFAKDVGAESVAAVVRSFRSGRTARVDVVWLNDSAVVLNTASIGAYPAFVRSRTRFQRRWISRPLATLLAIRSTLRHTAPVRVRIEGRAATVSFFFLGSSLYGTPGIMPGRRSRLDDGVLDVRYLEDGHRRPVLRLFTSWISGRVDESRIYREFRIPELTIESDRPFRVAHDGESGDLHTSAHFRVGYRQLRVFGTSVVW